MEFPSTDIQIEYFMQGFYMACIIIVTVIGIRIFKKLGSGGDSGMDQGL